MFETSLGEGVVVRLHFVQELDAVTRAYHPSYVGG
jgi:hypothetical protein